MVSSAEAFLRARLPVATEVAVDETKIEMNGTEHYVWMAVACETLKVLTFEISPWRSILEGLLF